MRAIGVAIGAAAHEAGFRTRDGRPLLPGNSARLDRRADVRGRKAHLAADEEKVIRETRTFVRERLLKVAATDLIGQFGIVELYERSGTQVGRLVGVDWHKIRESGAGIVVGSLRFDPETGALTQFTRDDALNALGQLRDMYGLKAPARVEGTVTLTLESLIHELMKRHPDQPTPLEAARHD